MNKEIEKKLNKYLNESCVSDGISFPCFARALLMMINDFLNGILDEKELGSLLNATYTTTPEISKFHKEPYLWDHNDFLAWISEVSDIAWMMNSPSYEAYKKELNEKHKKFIEKYRQFPSPTPPSH